MAVEEFWIRGHYFSHTIHFRSRPWYTPDFRWSRKQNYKWKTEKKLNNTDPEKKVRVRFLSFYRLHISIYFAYMFLPKWLTFYLTSLPQNKLLRSFAFTSSRIVLREHFCTLKYIPIQQGTRVCLHGSQARVKSTDPGPNHHLHNNKIKKILTPFFAVFCSQNINRYTSIYTSQKI